MAIWTPTSPVWRATLRMKWTPSGAIASATPASQDPAAFAAYMKKCQVETTFFFADVNNKTVQQTLRALKVQAGVAHFIEANQGKSAAEIQAAFRQFLDKVRHAPEPLAGEYERHPQCARGRRAAPEPYGSACRRTRRTTTWLI